MPAARRSFLSLLVLLGLLVPTRAGAATIAPGEALALIESRVAPAREQVAALRSVLADGGLTAAVRAGAIAAGRADAVAAPVVSPAPATLNEAVASIASAVERADALVKDGPAADLPGWVAAVAEEIAVTGLADPRAFRGLEPVDPGPALAAAAMIAAAVDGAMPALHAAAATMAPSPQVVGCDVLNTPTLCVGGTGDNVYEATESHMVIVDLGGNDTYLNDAGFVSAGAELVLDVAGNDRYLPAQGYGGAYGSVGGVGILFDVTGNDLYQWQSTTSEVVGMGLGLVGGAGFMVDGAGDDVYSMSSEVNGGPGGAGGMGEAVLGGVGVMVDGAGNDTYSARGIAHPVLGTAFDEEGNEVGPATISGRAAVSIGGIGVFGAAGLLADSGGNDSFIASSRMTAAPPDWPDPYFTYNDIGAIQNFAVVNGLGDSALAGAGYLLEGVGPTTYRLESDIESLPLHDPALYMNSLAQGGSSLGSIGVLSDAGGDDIYSLDLSATSAVARTVTDACPDPCELPNAVAIAPPVTASGQGYGVTGALGLVEDAAGNDTYRVRLNQSATAVVRDERTQPAAAVLSGHASLSGPTYSGQAAGVGAGTGAILDSQGNDKYETAITASAEVRGHAAVPANEPDVSAGSGNARALVQGSAGTTGAAGGLIDLGGYDAYSASVTSVTTRNGEEPIPGNVVVDAQAAAQEGATGLGLAVDLDGIQDDTYATIPPTPACQGVRGQAVWQDCGRVGIGVNA